MQISALDFTHSADTALVATWAAGQRGGPGRHPSWGSLTRGVSSGLSQAARSGCLAVYGNASSGESLK